MISWVVLCLLTLRFYRASGQGECTDLRGRAISHGLHYVPGPDTCTLCVCDNGQPRVCKAVLCSPPQDCRSFRVGNTCCEFICLDDVVKPADGGEANVRVAAGGAATVVLLTVALVVYRVRKQKRRRAPHTDDQRSLTSIGYISGSMGYMGGTCETALAAWKPPGNYLPRGEAPPPYDEAVAQCRQEALSRASNEPAYHRTYPATVETLARPDDPMQCSGHSYANIPRPMQQMANPQSCYNAPLLQAVPPEPRDVAPPPHPPLAHMVGFPSAIRLTGSLGAISNRGLLSLLQREPEPERPHNVPGFYTNAPNIHTSLHRTIPRISTAVDASILDTSISGFNRSERGLHAEIRRSFHKPSEARHDTGRSMPRNLNLACAPPAPPRAPSNIRVSASGVNATAPMNMPAPNMGMQAPNMGMQAPNMGMQAPNMSMPAPNMGMQGPNMGMQGPNMGMQGPHMGMQGPNMGMQGPNMGMQCSNMGMQASNMGVSASTMTIPTGRRDSPDGSEGKQGPKPPPKPVVDNCGPHGTLPLTVDKPSCDCSYEGEGAAGAEDADDYRNECENCKATSNSRWVVPEGWPDEEDEGTQTLQRRAPPPAPPPPATATLPQPVTKQPRTMMGPPSNWENWFNTIPDSDTESEEE